MGIPVLIMGASGSGKSASMRNFENGDLGILNVASKPLPFKKKLSKIDAVDYNMINGAITGNTFNTYVIDDSQFLMCFELFDKVNETGYGKFTQSAKNFYDLLKCIIEKTPADTIVYLLHHSEEGDGGKIKAKTSGKMLDSQLTVEGLFSVVLMADANDGKYTFITQSDGSTTCKSPMDMFPAEIDNDLRLVDNTIREYWNLSPRKKATPKPKK